MMDKEKNERKFFQLSLEDRDLTMFMVTDLTLTKKKTGNMVYIALKLKRKVTTELLTKMLTRCATPPTPRTVGVATSADLSVSWRMTLRMMKMRDPRLRTISTCTRRTEASSRVGRECTDRCRGKVGSTTPESGGRILQPPPPVLRTPCMCARLEGSMRGAACSLMIR